jgi:hypothetical protein
MMQEKDGDDGIVTALDGCALFEADIANAEPVRIGACLADSGWRKVQTGDFGNMRGKKQFGVSNPAPNAEEMRPWADTGLSENALDHMSAQGAHGRPCKVLLRKAGVKLFVILEFALKSIHLLDGTVWRAEMHLICR